MGTYHVSWEIDLHADSPREAAEQARAYQRDPHGTATVFYVTDSETLAAKRIDLLENDDD